MANSPNNVYSFDDMKDNISHHDNNDEHSVFEIHITTYVVAVDIIAGLGVIGNILTIVLMTSQTLRKHSFAVYLIVLAISDSLVLFMIAVEDNTDHIFNLLETMLNTHITICKLWIFLQECVKVLSPWGLVAVSFDRFITVVYPVTKARICTVKFAAVLICVLCSVVIILNMPYLFYLDYHPDEEIKEGYVCDFAHVGVDYYNLVMATLVQSVLPVSLLSILNIKTAVILRQTARSTSTNTENPLLKISISLILVSTLSAIALVPFAIVALIEFILIVSGSDDHTIALFGNLWMVFNVVRLLNYAMNFYVLMIFDHYRRILLNKFKWYCCKVRNGKQEDISFETICDGTNTNISPVTQAGTIL